jgi:hypothetical protein
MTLSPTNIERDERVYLRMRQGLSIQVSAFPLLIENPVATPR